MTAERDDNRIPRLACVRREVDQGSEQAKLQGNCLDPCPSSLTDSPWQDRSCRHDRKDKIRCNSASAMGSASIADSLGCLMQDTAVEQFNRAR